MLFRFVFRSRPLKQNRTRSWHLIAPHQSYTTTSYSRQDETASLKVGGNGFVDVMITKPIRPTKSNNVLVHLPPGPFPDGSPSDGLSTADSRQLPRQFPETTLVELQYRLSPRPNAAQAGRDNRFPTPVHDVFTAWEYILEEIAGADNDAEELKICLHGSHIGGALALTLALTNPNRIHAVVIEDPLVDWVVLDELAAYGAGDGHGTAGAKRRSRRHDSEATIADAARALIKLRTQLFRTPSGYFDAFASPTLFLRAPGRDTPLTKTAALMEPQAEFDEVVVEGAKIRYGEEEDEVGIVEYDERDEDFGSYDDDWHAIETRRIREGEYRYDTTSTGTSFQAGTKSGEAISGGSDGSSQSDSTDSSEPCSPAAVDSPRRRKVLRRWPPNAQPEGVVLPYVNVTLTKPSPDQQVERDQGQYTSITPVTWLQGRELAELLKRACFWGRERSFAYERVTLSECDAGMGSRDRQEQVVKWLQAKFGERS